MAGIDASIRDGWRSASVVDAISYEDLYARWERGNWLATEIDFSQDRADWHGKLTQEQRRSAQWIYTSFFHGEDAVANTLSPYIDAAPLTEQKYFLTTQQVDEARHGVFFSRFLREVIGLGDGTMAGVLHATSGALTRGHRRLFGRLDRMAGELRADPSRTTLARAVTLYHILVEATLAQPLQHIIERSLEELDVLPGFRSGLRNVALDEQRHIGFGVKVLADLRKEEPGPVQEAILEMARQVFPWIAALGRPPGGDRRYTECFNFTSEEVIRESARSLGQKLRAIGLPVDDLVDAGIPTDVLSARRAA